MSDLVTRILLEDKQFNNKINGAKQSLAGFDSQAGKAGGSVGSLDGKLGGLVGGGLTKLIGGFGIAATAGATFKKIIDSSQGSSDEFNNSLGAAKSTVDQFFKSISTGDFSNFVNGLGDVYERAKKAQQALDQLWNTQNAFNLGKSKVQYQISSARADAYDRELSPEERRRAIKEWQVSINEMGKYSETLQADLLTAAKNIASTYNTLKPESISLEDLTNTILIDVQGAPNRDELKKKAKSDYAEYQKAVKQAEKDATTTYKKATTVGRHTTYNKAESFNKAAFDVSLLKLNDRYKSSILTHSLLEKMSDEELEKLTKLAQDYQSTGQQVEQLSMEINKAKPRLEKQIESQLRPDKGGGKKVTVTAELIPQGSIAEIDKKLSDAKRAFANAATDDARAAADKLIKELESKKVVLEVSFKGAGGSIENEVKPLKTPDKITDFSGVNMKNQMYKPDIKVFDSYSDKVSHIASQNRDLIESFYGLGDALGGFSNLLGENGGEWLNWGANVFTTVGRSLPMLLSLSNANTAVAASGAAASVSNIPVVGPILAIGAVASILGALASIPKFEYGGIVGGNSYSGDKLLARVNSGEAILNTKQQASLVNQLESSDGRVGNVVFKISGKELVGILNQESVRASRR